MAFLDLNSTYNMATYYSQEQQLWPFLLRPRLNQDLTLVKKILQSLYYMYKNNRSMSGSMDQVLHYLDNTRKVDAPDSLVCLYRLFFRHIFRRDTNATMADEMVKLLVKPNRKGEFMIVRLEDMDFEAYQGDLKTKSAVERQLQIITEAAYRLGDEAEVLCPGPDWKGYMGMGNILRHGYHKVNDQIVWDTVKIDLPPLKEAVLKALADPSN